jgi:ATP-binding cassette subfamily F protein 1
MLCAVSAYENERAQTLKWSCRVIILTVVFFTEGEDGTDANAKDIKIDSFSVSARGKELLKNTPLTIVHGRRYGLVGPNGKGKSTLLKLLAWRQIPVPRNIDVLLVEQEVVGDERTALEAVVSADEELMSLRSEAARLQELTLKDEDELEKDDDAANAGDQLTAVYERLQAIGADAAEARGSKILAGLGFSKDMQVSFLIFFVFAIQSVGFFWQTL